MSADDTRLERWRNRTEGPLFVFAVLYLLAWSLLVLVTDLPIEWVITLLIVIVVTWLSFAVDYVVSVVLAPRRGTYVLTHVPDLLAVILPFLRPVVQLTHIRSIPYFRRRTGNAQRTRIILLAASFGAVFVYSIALAVYSVERNAPGSLMTSFGDAIWWAFVTIFTVGYGDIYPVTPQGRFYAVLLMLGGIGIIGTASAIVVSYLNERIRTPRDQGDEEQ